MRFVFAAAGSFGDVAPLITLACELRARGHEIRWVMNPYHLKAVRRWGFEGISAGDAATVERTVSDPRLNSPFKYFQVMQEAGKADAVPMTETLMEQVGSADVLVYRSLLGVGRMVEEKTGIPACAIHVSPTESSGEEDRACMGGHLTNALIRNSPRWSYNLINGLIERRVIDRSMWKWINPLRRQFGLPERKDSYRDWMHESALTLGLFPEWFGRLTSRTPDHARQTGFAFLPQPDEAELDPELEAFLEAGEPPVAISQGSALQGVCNLNETLTEACRDLGCRSLRLAFDHEGPPVIDGDHCVTAPVPIPLVLPRCRALAHRGGLGLLADGMREGIPQFVLAQVVDHPDNGERLTRLGAGRWVYGLTATTAQIRRELERVLGDPEIRRGAEAVAARCDPEGWRNRSADLIEGLGVLAS